jgi:hypothetical protein
VKGGSRRMLMVFHSEPCTLTHPHNSAVLYDDMAATLDGPFAPLMAPAIIDCGTGGGLLGVQWNSRDARYNDIGRKDTSLGESCTGWPIEWLETGVGSKLSGERGSHLASGAWRQRNLTEVQPIMIVIALAGVNRKLVNSILDNFCHTKHKKFI